MAVQKAKFSGGWQKSPRPQAGGSSQARQEFSATHPLGGLGASVGSLATYQSFEFVSVPFKNKKRGPVGSTPFGSDPQVLPASECLYASCAAGDLHWRFKRILLLIPKDASREIDLLKNIFIPLTSRNLNSQQGLDGRRISTADLRIQRSSSVSSYRL
ncbi:MAG: hypothetical protein M3160_06880 [Candidatus Eremiobacteraeota bacterium]|nr:hypothetical protein [Candidatus Eremiobacteraeota bacterium]